MMNFKTFNNRYSKLIREVSAHPHKDELLNIMLQQVSEDTSVIDPEYIPIKAK